MEVLAENTRPGYKLTKLGWIPDDWEIRKIGKIGRIKVGRDLKVEAFSQELTEEHIYPVYSNTVEEKGLYGYYSKPEYEAQSLTIVGRGVGLGTTFFRDIKYGAIGRLLVLYPNKSYDHRFLTYFINSRVRFFTESSGIPQLTGLQLATYAVAAPLLGEQKAIAQVLSTWDKSITDLTQLISEKQQKKKALMQQLLTGKKRFPGFDGEWGEYTYKELLKEVKSPVEWDDSELYQLISVRRRSGGLFKRESLYGHQIKTKNLGTAKTGDFLFSKMQIVHGASGLVSREFDGQKISGSYIAVRSKNEAVLNIKFLNWYSKMPYFYHQTYISSYGVHIEKMTFDFKSFLKLTMKVPSLEEQNKIVRILEAADSELELLNQKLDKMKDQKKGLMQQLLTGKKRLKY